MFVLSLVLTGAVGCDQATKQLAISELRGEAGESLLDGVIRLVYAENPGAFLSLFGDLPRVAQFWILTAGVGLLLAVCLGYLMMSSRLGRLQSLALALLAGGGISNWLDRVMNEGRVVDFIIVTVGPLRTGVFNVADVVIMIGAGLLLLAARASQRQPVPVTAPAGRDKSP